MSDTGTARTSSRVLSFVHRTGHPHMLRHTFVTRLLDAKAPLEWVNQLAGHKSFAMTKRYDHAEFDRYVPAIKALDEASPIDREALIASIRQPE